MSRRERILLFASIVVVYLAHFNPVHFGANRYVYLAMALAEQGRVSVDGFAITYPLDLFSYGGHLYCDNNPGLSLLAAPFWVPFGLVLRHLSGSSVLAAPAIHFFLAHLVTFAFATAVPSALTSLVVGELVFDATRCRTRAIVAVLLNAFGTIAFRFSAHLNQNVLVTAIVVLVFSLLVRPEVLGVTRPLTRSVLVGMLLGFGVLVDLSIIPFGVACIPWLLRANRTSRARIVVVASGLPMIAALAAFQFVAYGNPFRDVHSYYPVEGRVGPSALITPNLRILASYLVLPSHGLIFFCPAAALGIGYLVWPPRGSRWPADQRLFALITVVMYLFYVLFSFGAQFSQFGPRYLMPILPLAIVAFCVEAPSLRGPLVTMLMGISFYVNVAGAEQSFGTDNISHYIALYAVRGPWLPIVDWMSSPEVTAARENAGVPLPEHTSPSGLFLLLFVVLVGLWIARPGMHVDGSRDDAAVRKPLPDEGTREQSS